MVDIPSLDIVCKIPLPVWLIHLVYIMCESIPLLVMNDTASLSIVFNIPGLPVWLIQPV